MHFVVRSGLISPVPSLFVRIATTIVVLIGGMFIIGNQLTVGAICPVHRLSGIVE